MRALWEAISWAQQSSAHPLRKRLLQWSELPRGLHSGRRASFCPPSVKNRSVDSAACSSVLRPTRSAPQTSMLEDLKGDEGRQIVVLTELAEYLSFSSEELLVCFPVESFVTVRPAPRDPSSRGTALSLLCLSGP